MDHYTNLLVFVAGFSIIALASGQIGQVFVKANLPLITGFLFAGIITGPFVLGLIPEEALSELYFVNEISLAFIAFAAGSELYLKELRSRFKSIIWVTIGNLIVIPTLGALAIFLLADFVPFMRDLARSGRIAVSILAGAILVARSPSSAIAVVNELRAKGPFTQTVLGVTMITDVGVIVLFAINSSITDALLTGLGLDLTFIILLLAELLLSLLLGYLLGKFLTFILSRHVPPIVKTSGILLAGFAIFVLSTQIREFSHTRLSFEIFLEPLLICMVGSFVVTNYTRLRPEFLKIVHDTSPVVYIVFFTLTGVTLALDLLAEIWLIALIVFCVRLATIFLGSFFGGVLAGDPMQQNRLSWMAYVAQAGVGLGLAAEVGVEFPAWGSAFATMIIAVIVLSQLIGPPLFKWAVHSVGEAHTRAAPSEFDGVRDAIIFGLEGQSLALASQLRSHGWQVKIVARQKTLEQKILDVPADVYSFSKLDLELMHRLEAEKADAIVALLSDKENYELCELAYEHFGTKDLVIRLNDRANFDRFHDLGALIVDPATAIVSLLDHLVRSPAAASLLLGMEAGQDIVDYEVRNPDLHGLALRDLRFPLDTLILSVHRQGRLLISHGYTRLKIGDRVTIVGSEKSLDEVALHFEA